MSEPTAFTPWSRAAAPKAEEASNINGCRETSYDMYPGVQTGEICLSDLGLDGTTSNIVRSNGDDEEGDKSPRGHVTWLVGCVEKEVCIVSSIVVRDAIL